MAANALAATFVTPEEVAASIPDGATICTSSASSRPATPAASRCCTRAASPTAPAASSTSPTRAS